MNDLDNSWDRRLRHRSRANPAALNRRIRDRAQHDLARRTNEEADSGEPQPPSPPYGAFPSARLTYQR